LEAPGPTAVAHAHQALAPRFRGPRSRLTLGLGNALPDFAYELPRFFRHGPLVCVEWILTGTHEGPLPGPGGRIEPTGRR